MSFPIRLLIFLFFVLQAGICISQPVLHRTYPQNITYFGLTVPVVETPIATPDGGYLLVCKAYQYGFEQPGYMVGKCVIKTDANFLPLWKKKYPAVCVLPSGGFILYGNDSIEKVTASGVQVWIKKVGPNISLTDAVSYGTNVRFVGCIGTYSYVPASTGIVYIYDGFTLLTDSNGVYGSHQLFYSNITNTYTPLTYTYRGSSAFSRIERDAAGDFYVYNHHAFTFAGFGEMVIAKFNSSFTLLWARYSNTPVNRFSITDIDLTSAGRIFASGYTGGNSNNNYQSFAAMVKMDLSGNIVQQKYFPTKPYIGKLCRKANDNYIVATNKADSVFLYETDTLMNIQWHKLRATGRFPSGSIISGTSVYTPMMKGNDPVLFSNDLSGSSCASYTMPYVLTTTSLVLTNCSLTPVASVCTIVATSANSIFTQSSVDSCICPVFISNLQSNICVGLISTVTIQGTGNLSWYASATGNSFIQSGSQFVFTSNTPTVITVFAQDSACVQFPNRTPVSVTIQALPTVTFSPMNPTICIGQNVFVSAGGAISYSWTNGVSNPTSNVQNLNPTSTTIYTVTGSVGQACSNTQTVGVYPIQVPSLSIAGNTNICVGTTAIFTAGGAPIITWPGSIQSPTYAITPSVPGPSTIMLNGYTGNCQSFRSLVINRVAYPTISVVPNNTIVCSGQTYTLSASGAGSYTWSTGQQSNPIYPIAVSNTLISVSASSLGCISTVSANINTVPSPTMSVVASQTQLCIGSSVSFSANGANAYVWQGSANGSTYTTLPPVGNQSITVVGSIGNCTAAAASQINVYAIPTIAVTSSPTIACAGKQNTLIVSGANTYSWSNGTNGNQAILIPFASTTVSVIGWNAGICSDTTTFSLQVFPSPSITASPSNTSTCFGNSVTLVASGAASLSWSGGIQNNVPFVPMLSGMYTVTGTDPNTCTGTATAQVTVFALPSLSVAGITEKICEGTQISWTASGAATYTWSNGSNNPVITATPAATFVYSLTGTDNNGCVNTYTFVQAMQSCTGIEQVLAFENNLSVYPNPAKEMLYVASDFLLHGDVLFIYDAQGKLIISKVISGQSIQVDLEGLDKGLYLLQLQRAGIELGNRKILVE